MIINTIGAEFEYDGTKYVIGEPVIGTEESEYEGLQGVITEIRTGEDKDTENETPDLYCSFEAPIIGMDIKKLEDIFSDLYGEPKTLDDISLDSVIMAPSMVCPLADIEKNLEEHTVYVLEEDWAIDDDYGHNTEIFTDFASAKRKMVANLKEEMDNGCILGWMDDEKFVEESISEFYDCFIDGEYASNHYSLEINKQTIKMEPAFVREVSDKYLNRCRFEDFKSQIEDWDEVDKITPKYYEMLITDKRIPERIENSLSKNDSYYEAYWESVSEVAHELVREYVTISKEAN